MTDIVSFLLAWVLRFGALDAQTHQLCIDRIGLEQTAPAFSPAFQARFGYGDPLLGFGHWSGFELPYAQNVVHVVYDGDDILTLPFCGPGNA